MGEKLVARMSDAFEISESGKFLLNQDSGYDSKTGQIHTELIAGRCFLSVRTAQ